MRFPRSNRKTWLLAGVLVVVAAVVAAYAIHELGKPSNTVNNNAAFNAPTTTNTTPAATKHINSFSWPFYGYLQTRTRDFTGDANLNPPLRESTSFGGNALLEFPASIYGNDLYFLDGGATAKKVNMRLRGSKKLIWLTHIGLRSASTPALDPKRQEMFVTVLSTASSSIDSFDGELAALSMKTGKILWTYKLPSGSGTESSPMIVGNSVYFGDEAGGNSAGSLYSLNITTHKVNWSLPVGGAVKAGPAYYKGNLYFGTYGGSFYAVNAKSGKVTWHQNTGGEYYSTPAIGFGRVYVGNLNGAAYSFVASNGTIAWTRTLGNYVYSGPAVADPKGLGPTVYIGYYSGQSGGLDALNAQTGAPTWSHDAGDAVSGSATVINNTVYFSTVYKPNVTYGLNTVTGKEVFSFHDGAYTSVVADPKAIYLMGRYVLYKFKPTK
jgi:outer membrane protein assembly factor BamB